MAAALHFLEGRRGPPTKAEGPAKVRKTAESSTGKETPRAAAQEIVCLKSTPAAGEMGLLGFSMGIHPAWARQNGHRQAPKCRVQASGVA